VTTSGERRATSKGPAIGLVALVALLLAAAVFMFVVNPIPPPSAEGSPVAPITSSAQEPDSTTSSSPVPTTATETVPTETAPSTPTSAPLASSPSAPPPAPAAKAVPPPAPAPKAVPPPPPAPPPPPPAPAPPPPAPAPAPQAVPAAAPQAAAAPSAPCAPSGFSIPAMGIDAPVVRIGLDASGNLGVPSDADKKKAGWYPNAVLAGSRLGSIIMDGHTYRDGSAIFTTSFDSTVRVGMTVGLSCGGGTFPYRISELKLNLNVGDYSGFVDGRRLYAPDGPPQIVMVTCTDWNPVSGTFDRRAILIATPMS